MFFQISYLFIQNICNKILLNTKKAQNKMPVPTGQISFQIFCELQLIFMEI